MYHSLLVRVDVSGNVPRGHVPKLSFSTVQCVLRHVAGTSVPSMSKYLTNNLFQIAGYGDLSKMYSGSSMRLRDGVVLLNKNNGKLFERIHFHQLLCALYHFFLFAII